MSVFDPFGDFETRGYLRNVGEVKDLDIVKRIEHNAFSRNITRALSYLQGQTDITHESVRETHGLLFADVYPWAGQDRSQNAPDLHITKGEVEFQLAPYVPHGVDHALNGAKNLAAFRENPGKLIGELAYAHPFLDGNGRTITAVVTELARRAGFQIAWQETNKQDYLSALTKELDDPKGRHLTNYLKPFIRQSALDIERAARTLTTLPGLSAPDRNLSGAQDSQPTLTIVTGPNGAGKSTLTASGALSDQPVIDPDAIARSLNPDNPEAAATRAGKRALDLRNQYLKGGQSFVVETTLSGNSTLSLMDEAKAKGFRIDLKYVGLENVDLATSRVAARVAAGGHNIAQEDIERRFARSRENLPEAISKADQTELYDNSGRAPHCLVASLGRDQFRFRDAPGWATDVAFDSAQNQLSKATTVQELERATSRALDAARAAGVTEDQLNREVKKLERSQKRQKTREDHDL